MKDRSATRSSGAGATAAGVEHDHHRQRRRVVELGHLVDDVHEPGFGGQKFLDLCLPKIRRARALLDRTGGDIWLQVDGGVSGATVAAAAEAGADTFVAGSAVYGADDPEQAVTALREAASAAWQDRAPWTP